MQKKQKQITAVVMLIIMCITLLSGCTTLDNFTSAFMKADAKEKAVIKVGVFEPLSGKEKEHGELELQGIELAHNLFPEALGKKVELVYADNKSDVDVAASAAQDLIDKKVSVVLGSHESTLSLVGGEYFAKAKIPAITITSTNPLVTSSSDYYFRTCIVESFQGVALAKFTVEQMGTSKAAIFKDADDDYAAAVSQTFTDKMVQLTTDENAISKVMEYTSKQEDFKTQLRQIKDSGIGVVLLASKAADAIKIMKQAKEMGIQLVFLGTDGWESEDFLKEGGAAVEGAVFSTFFDPEAAITENTEVFLKAYREKYGEDAEPASDVALGFDAYMLALNAIGMAGTSVNGEAIRDQLAATKNFPGASGNITFDENGDPIKSVAIKTIINGKFVHIYTVEPTWQ
ncbi:MAG TPA: ABC transporter substrate-binding protein [Anaerovoracaceae bacterium]|nr:ABC transporter substrate-binding protein [Anaerovoracaceae bacterium]